jgi:DNA-binding response OmpR family regulator
MNSTILISEDDKDLREFLEEILQEHHYTVYTTDTGAQALKMVDKIQPNLVLLDLGLPDINGETVCARIKQSYPQLQVIILTASSETKDVVGSFDKGADDYLTKPFVNDELLARIKARLRKQKRDNAVLKIDDLMLNTTSMEVSRNGTDIDLTKTEFELLHYLMVNAKHVLSREQILSHVWSQDPDVETRVVDVYIGYLRKKIDGDSPNKLIHSKRGYGYVLKA